MGKNPIEYKVGDKVFDDTTLPWAAQDYMPYGAEAALFSRGKDASTGKPVMGLPPKEKQPNWMASFIADPKIRAAELKKGRAQWDAYWKDVESKKNHPTLGEAARALLEFHQRRGRKMANDMMSLEKTWKTPADWMNQKTNEYIVGENTLPDEALAAFNSRLA